MVNAFSGYGRKEKKTPTRPPKMGHFEKIDPSDEFGDIFKNAVLEDVRKMGFKNPTFENKDGWCIIHAIHSNDEITEFFRGLRAGEGIFYYWCSYGAIKKRLATIDDQGYNTRGNSREIYKYFRANFFQSLEKFEWRNYYNYPSVEEIIGTLPNVSEEQDRHTRERHEQEIKELKSKIEKIKQKIQTNKELMEIFASEIDVLQASLPTEEKELETLMKGE